MSAVAGKICKAILSRDKAGLASLLLYATKSDLRVETINGDTFRTSLMLAAENAHVDALQMLISAGADLDQKENESGWTALVFASREGHAAEVTVLLQAGAGADIKTHEGSTALMIAATWNHATTVAALLQARADVNCRDGGGNTALVLAAENAHLEVVQLLLQAKAEVDIVNDAGNSALMLAAHEGATLVVVELLQAGADAKLINAKGETALSIASSRGNLTTVQVLQDALSGVKTEKKERFPALAVDALHPAVTNGLASTAPPTPVHGGHANADSMLRSSTMPTLCVSEDSTTVVADAPGAEAAGLPTQEAANKVQLSDGLEKLCISRANSSRVSPAPHTGRVGTPEVTPDTSPRGTPKRRARTLSFRTGAADGCECSPSGSFHSGRLLITEVRPLSSSSDSTARALYQGQFQGKDHAGASCAVRCVIKCAGKDGRSPTTAEIAVLRRESERYQALQSDAQGAQTGCVHLFSSHPEGHYIVLEHHGGDLRTLLAADTSDPQHVVEGIARAMLALHLLGIMHGDIRPENILYTFSALGQCVVKFSNLKCARREGDVCSAGDIGNEPYLAPEIYTALQTAGTTVEASLAIDMYALGLVLAQVLRRSVLPALAFTETETETRLACYADEALRWSHLRVPAPYEELVRGLTCTDPQQRTDTNALWRQVKMLTGTVVPKETADK